MLSFAVPGAAVDYRAFPLASRGLRDPCLGMPKSKSTHPGRLSAHPGTLCARPVPDHGPPVLCSTLTLSSDLQGVGEWAG